MRYLTINEIQNKYHLTLAKIANKMNCSISLLSKIGNNKEKITNTTQSKCFKAFNCYLKNDIQKYDYAYNQLLIKFNELQNKYDSLQNQCNAYKRKLLKIGVIINE